MLEIKAKVKFVKTADKTLDGQTGIVLGYYGRDCIVMFDKQPKNYHPAIVINQSCLEEIKNG